MRLAESGRSIAAGARSIGVGEQILLHWVKAQHEGWLSSADSKPESAEQMEISRLRAELARVKMERDILKRRRRTSRKSRCEVRLRLATPQQLAGSGDVRGARRQPRRLPPALRAQRVGQLAYVIERRRAAGAHQGDSHREQRQLRLAQGLKGVARSRHSCGQGPGAQADAAALHQGARQAQLQGYDRQPATICR